MPGGCCCNTRVARAYQGELAVLLVLVHCGAKVIDIFGNVLLAFALVAVATVAELEVQLASVEVVEVAMSFDNRRGEAGDVASLTFAHTLGSLLLVAGFGRYLSGSELPAATRWRSLRGRGVRKSAMVHVICSHSQLCRAELAVRRWATSA